MRLTRIITATALVIASLAAVTGISGAVARKTDTRAQKIERGRYLATTMGCNDCHTPGMFYGAPDFARQLSGSELGWSGPWGVSFARNLTPHAQTGIGGWSEAQIVNALRTGVRPDGSTLLPPMPWPNYALLTDADAYAIAAFLKSLPAVEHHVPAVVPPGTAYAGVQLVFPPPPAWDAPRPTSSDHAASGSR
ncbi:MAG: cytochrome c [Candidatus Eisenbacteria bacterium]|nr:cytochrome c [Candidatus Eisenbacteria bacterium]